MMDVQGEEPLTEMVIVQPPRVITVEHWQSKTEARVEAATIAEAVQKLIAILKEKDWRNF